MQFLISPFKVTFRGPAILVGPTSCAFENAAAGATNFYMVDSAGSFNQRNTQNSKYRDIC